MYQLSFSFYCPPGAFCHQNVDELPPTTLHAPEDWELLAKAEVCMEAYFVVGGVWVLMLFLSLHNRLIIGRALRPGRSTAPDPQRVTELPSIFPHSLRLFGRSLLFFGRGMGA